MQARRILSGVLLAVGSSAAVVACGGSSTDGTAFIPTDGGGGAASGGATTGSTGGVGGAGGAAGGSSAGGAAPGGAGGAAGSGGSGGSGGALTGDAGGCPNPIKAGTTRICLHVIPEDIKPTADPALDESGVLIVQIFDTPTPPDKNAGLIALAERVLPEGALPVTQDGGATAEIALKDLKELRFDKAFPSTVYVRVFFVDDPAFFAKKNAEPNFGTWLGGMSLAGGLAANIPLTAVPLATGLGNTVDVSLTALRRLRVTVHQAVAGPGDGQGPLAVVVVGGTVPKKGSAIFGTASKKCADVSAGDVTVTGFVIGSGPLWVAGVLNDLGQPGDLPAGSLSSLVGTPPALTIPTKLSYAPTDYTVKATIDLTYVAPWSGDAGIPPNSCADLAGGVDGGP